MQKYFIILFFVICIITSHAQVLTIDTTCVNTTRKYVVPYNSGNTYYWNVTGGNIISPMKDTIIVTWGNVPGLYPIFMIETNSFLCPGDTNFANVLVLPEPVVNLGNDTTICKGVSMVLNATTPNATYLWNNNSTNSTYNVTTSGIYWVKVSIDNLCCASDTIKINTIDTPPDFYLFSDTTLCAGTPINIITPENTYYNILWYDGNNSEFSHLINQTGNYYVELLNQCDTIRKEFNITYKDCNCYIYFPNAFTPNGDGINDYFKPVFQCELTTYELYIYDRWGELVFDTKTNGVYWDGKYKNEYVPTGVYGWLFYYKGPYTRDLQYKKGSVTVVR